MLTPVSESFVVLSVEDHFVANRTRARSNVAGDGFVAAREVNDPLAQVGTEFRPVDS